MRVRPLLARYLRRPDRLERRLSRLRAIYASDPAVSLQTRRVRDVLRGQVAPEYQRYYDRLLRIEGTITELLRHDVPPSLTTSDLIVHIQTLTERVMRLLEQVQRCDRLQALYEEGSPQHGKIVEARQLLMVRVDESIALQESIPISVLQLSTTAASTGQHFTRLRGKLDDIKARLEDMTESYAELESREMDILEMSVQYDKIEPDHYQEKNETS